MRKTYMHSDLFIVSVWVIMTFIFVITPALENSIIRTILGIPMVLFIPGYVLIAALFPKKSDLESIERIALSFGMSIAVVPLIGLGLNFTPFGIRLIPILVSLCIYTTLLIIVAKYRRGLCGKEQFSVPFRKTYEEMINEINKPKSKVDNILTIVLIITIILAIGTLVYVIAMPKIGERFTEFYILNSSSQKADNYPTNLKIDQPVTYLVGISNHEYSPVNYTIEIINENKSYITKNLTLEDNQTWENNMTIAPDKKGTDMKLEFLLFKENNFTAPYRDLHLWVNVT